MSNLTDDILSNLDIVDVISKYVQLKKAGSNFSGLSPFQSEKTPSFMVSPQKQIFKDFSS
jgi:DNA primase